jgi:hypothetical protein
MKRLIRQSSHQNNEVNMIEISLAVFESLLADNIIDANGKPTWNGIMVIKSRGFGVREGEQPQPEATFDKLVAAGLMDANGKLVEKEEEKPKKKEKQTAGATA